MIPQRVPILQGGPDAYLDFDFRFGQEAYWLNRQRYGDFSLVPGATSTGGAGFGTVQRNGIWTPVPANAPLIGDGGLRNAELRTNSIPHPTGFTNSAWVKVGGAVTGSLFSEDGATSAHGLDISTTVGAGVQTVEFRIKYAGRRWVRIDPYGAASPGNDSVWFDILNGVKGAEQANCTGAIVPDVDGGYRIAWQATTTAGSLVVSLRGASADNDGLNYSGLAGPAYYLSSANLKPGPDINDPPILQTTGLPATRTGYSYFESGRNIAPVHFGVVRARLLAPLANHAVSFPQMLDIRASSGVARVAWYGLQSDGSQRFHCTGDNGTSGIINPGADPVVGQHQTFAWACRAGSIAISRDGAAVQVTGVPSIASPFTRVGWMGGALTPGQNPSNAETELCLTANGEISNDALQALSARFAA